MAVASILMQKDDEGILHPICYYSKKMTQAQRNYTVTDKEALSLILAV